MKCSNIQKLSKALADETRLSILDAVSAAEQTTPGESVFMREVSWQPSLIL